MICRRFTNSDTLELISLLARIDQDGTALHFRPHPMTAEEAVKMANYAGQDHYAGVWVGDCLRGYGCLRGWDEGYEIPSLGIYMLPEARGTGLAQAMMAHLHEVAQNAGAPKVRLRVKASNERAWRLYEKFDYEFPGTFERGELVGIKVLTTQAKTPVDKNEAVTYTA